MGSKIEVTLKCLWLLIDQIHLVLLVYPFIIDPALMRPGRLDRKVEFSLPDLEGRTQIFKIHARTMSMEKNIRFELLARLCPNTTGAELRSVCTEAGIGYIFMQGCLQSEQEGKLSVRRICQIRLKK